MSQERYSSAWSAREDGQYHAAQMEPGETVEQYLARAIVPEHHKPELRRWITKAIELQELED